MQLFQQQKLVTLFLFSDHQPHQNFIFCGTKLGCKDLNFAYFIAHVLDIQRFLFYLKTYYLYEELFVKSHDCIEITKYNCFPHL